MKRISSAVRRKQTVSKVGSKVKSFSVYRRRLFSFMDVSVTERRRPHIVMLPFMAQGHLIPFLSLATLIDQRHRGRFTITLLNTAANVRTLRSCLSPNSNILLTELPFSSADHGLPPDAENTDSLRYEDMGKLLQGSGALQPHFERLLLDVTEREGQSPICIVGDFLVGWTAIVAKKLGIFHATFSTCSAYGTATYFAMWLHLPDLSMEGKDFLVPGFPDNFRLHRSQLPRKIRETGGTDGWSVYLRKQISLCLESGGMLCNTVESMERMGIDLLRKVLGLPIWAVGPVRSNDGNQPAGKKTMASMERVIRWLDNQFPASVLYVSFGTQNTIGISQTLQLAAGLEASGHPFIWAIRPPLGFELDGDFREEWLPEGFENRMTDSSRGLLLHGWAPQLEILSHRSTGAFLTHCGWNSALESLGSAVPLIGWPMGAEQFFNSKMLEEELGVSLELARGATADVVCREVDERVREVMGAEKGGDMRRRAAECSEMIGAAMGRGEEKNGPSLSALDDFLETLLEGCLQEQPVDDLF